MRACAAAEAEGLCVVDHVSGEPSGPTRKRLRLGELQVGIRALSELRRQRGQRLLLRGSLTLRAPTATLAYAITKATEGFIYSDPVAKIDPDIDAAMSIIRLLLE
jgi:hypothetical protein